MQRRTSQGWLSLSRPPVLRAAARTLTCGTGSRQALATSASRPTDADLGFTCWCGLLWPWSLPPQCLVGIDHCTCNVVSPVPTRTFNPRFQSLPRRMTLGSFTASHLNNCSSTPKLLKGVRGSSLAGFFGWHPRSSHFRISSATQAGSSGGIEVEQLSAQCSLDDGSSGTWWYLWHLCRFSGTCTRIVCIERLFRLPQGHHANPAVFAGPQRHDCAPSIRVGTSSLGSHQHQWSCWHESPPRDRSRSRDCLG
mmetsp:Transcript_15601/g.42758  ORF Transcript_15601/g.42758 Transcript_15601/m.42758 type:complete len:252 (+) Transcript_15601:474-1229(+)